MWPGAVAGGWASVAAGTSSSSNDITPGLLGFVVIAAMGVALFFLLRSMNKHLRRVRMVRDAGLQPGSKIEAGVGSTVGGRKPADSGSEPGERDGVARTGQVAGAAGDAGAGTAGHRGGADADPGAQGSGETGG